MKWGRLLSILSVTIFGILYFVHQNEESEQTRKSGVSVYNEGALGTSSFRKFLELLGGNRSSIRLMPLLKASDLESQKSYFLNSTLGSLSQRELEVLAGFVEGGGLLYISSERAGFSRTHFALLKKFGLPTEFENSDHFKNETIFRLAGLSGSPIFAESKTYEFYSPLQIAGCHELKSECFVAETKYGKGHVILQLGIPLFSNALLARGDNRGLALAISENFLPAAFDEYHNYFSSKTFIDFLTLWNFSLPLFGLLLILILFFIYGRTPFHRHSLRSLLLNKRTVLSTHELSENLIYRAFDTPGERSALLERQAGFLKRLFPLKKGEIDSVRASSNPAWPESLGRELLTLHRKLMKEQRGQT